MSRRPLLAALLVLAGCGHSYGPTAMPVSAESGPAGSFARDYLSDATYSSLVIEADYMHGAEPSAESLSILAERLAARCHKPGGVTAHVGRELSEEKPLALYRLEDLRGIEARSRRLHADGTTATLHVLYVDGPSDRKDLLGCSLSATSFAVFARTVSENVPVLAKPTAFEAAVLVHEAGHLLGLVGLGAPCTSAHEDPVRPHHCKTYGCIMAAESTSWKLADATFGFAPVADFDEACVADLRAAGGR